MIESYPAKLEIAECEKGRAETSGRPFDAVGATGELHARGRLRRLLALVRHQSP
jgi:hypothetical protein